MSQGLAHGLIGLAEQIVVRVFHALCPCVRFVLFVFVCVVLSCCVVFSPVVCCVLWFLVFVCLLCCFVFLACLLFVRLGVFVSVCVFFAFVLCSCRVLCLVCASVFLSLFLSLLRVSRRLLLLMDFFLCVFVAVFQSSRLFSIDVKKSIPTFCGCHEF